MWDLIVSVPDHCLSFYFTLFAPIGQMGRQSQCCDVTFAGPKKTTDLFPATCRCRESNPDRSSCTMILKTECLLIMNGPIQYIVF